MQEEQICMEAEQFFRELNVSAMLFNIKKWAKEGIDKNETVEKALNVLDKVLLTEIEDGNLIKLAKGEHFYRARVIEIKDYKDIGNGLGYTDERMYGFNAEGSKEPPIDKCTKDYRNSPAGVVALYVASDEVTACLEVRPEIRQFVSIAEFELQEEVSVLDFSKIKNFDRLEFLCSEYDVNVMRFVRDILFLFTEPVYSKDESLYKVTQKIVEHYKVKGIKGFKYKSFYSTGMNYTFFDEEMSKFKWIDSRVLLNYAVGNLFLSLDKKGMKLDIDSSDMISKGVDDKLREELRETMHHLFACRHLN